MNIKTTIALLVTASLAACVIEPPKGDVELAQLAVTATPVVSATPVVTDTVATATPVGEVTPTVTATEVPTTPTPTSVPGDLDPAPIYKADVVYGAYLTGTADSLTNVVFANSETGDLRKAAELSITLNDQAVSPANGDIAVISNDGKLIQLDRDFNIEDHGQLPSYDSSSAMQVAWTMANGGVIYSSNAEGLTGLSHYSLNLDEPTLLTGGEAVSSYLVSGDDVSLAFQDISGKVLSNDSTTSVQNSRIRFEQALVDSGALNSFQWCGNELLGLQSYKTKTGQQVRLLKLDGGATANYLLKPSSDDTSARDVKAYQCGGNTALVVTNYITPTSVNREHRSAVLIDFNAASAATYKPIEVGGYSVYQYLMPLSDELIFAAGAVNDAGVIAIAALHNAAKGELVLELDSNTTSIGHFSSDWVISTASNSTIYKKQGSGAYGLVASTDMLPTIFAESPSSTNILTASPTLVEAYSESGELFSYTPIGGSIVNAQWLGDAFALLVIEQAGGSKGAVILDIQGQVVGQRDLDKNLTWAVTKSVQVK